MLAPMRSVQLRLIVLMTALGWGCELGPELYKAADECEEGDPAGGIEACGGDCGGPSCGDGVLDDGETCDDGDSVDWDGCTGCRVTEFRLSSRGAESQDMAVVAMREDGGFVSAWTGDLECASGTGVHVRCWDAGASGPDIVVNGPNNGACCPSLAVAPDGSFMVAWHSRSTYFQLFDTACHPLGPVVRAGVDGAPDLAFVPSGHYLVTWHEADTWEEDTWIYTRFVRPDPLELGPLIQVATSSSEELTTAKLSAGPDGRFVVAWRGMSEWVRLGEHLYYSNLYARLYDPDGIATSDVLLIEAGSSEPAGGYMVAHDVVMGSEGGFVVVWSVSGEAGVLAREYDGDGVPTGIEAWIDLDMEDALDTRIPAIVPWSGGYILAVEGQTEHTRNVHALVLDLDLGPSGSGFMVHDWSASRQSFPSLAAHEDGRFIVAWTSEDQDGDDTGVFAQRFSADGSPVGVVPW